jgi:chitin disaccharide deacetylase
LRQLVVNADDFGFTRDVNHGIIEAHTRGILTATTLMANGAAFDDAVRLAREHPALDVGCHLVLVQGPSVLSPNRALPASLQELVTTLCRRGIRVYDELRAQVERIAGAGLNPTHLDTHKHTHLLPPVLDAVCRIAEEFRIQWVRRPFDFPLSGGPVPISKRALSRSLHVVRRRFHRKLTQHGCRTTDQFAGFQLTGRFGAAELTRLLRALPPGSTEFMCHPGRCTDELRGMRTRLKESRERELNALTAPEVRQALTEEGIRLVSYRELA